MTPDEIMAEIIALKTRIKAACVSVETDYHYGLVIAELENAIAEVAYYKALKSE